MPSDYEFQLLKPFYPFKDVRGWQFFTMKAAETLYKFAYHQRNTFAEKNIWVTDLPKNHMGIPSLIYVIGACTPTSLNKPIQGAGKVCGDSQDLKSPGMIKR